jgi:hypothetical protein
MGLSLKPSEMVEGGVVPVDQNLTIKEARFTLFDYTKKDGTVVATTVAVRIKTTNDDGQEFEQQYSVGDPAKFSPSTDGKNPAKEGKFIIAIGAQEALSKSSNFYILQNNLVNAGFPENKLGDDISVLEGLYAYWIGVPEPKRAGLTRVVAAGEAVRERVISVPSQIHKLPWEKSKGKAAAAVKGKAPTAAAPDESILKAALEFVGKQIEASDDGTVTRQDLAGSVFRELAKSPNRDAIATLIFAPAMQAALVANGYAVDGETISKAD